VKQKMALVQTIIVYIWFYAWYNKLMIKIRKIKVKKRRHMSALLKIFFHVKGFLKKPIDVRHTTYLRYGINAHFAMINAF
jgi:hypothetical protein